LNVERGRKELKYDRRPKTEKLTSELEKGITLSKCRKCGCMKGALEEIREILSHDPGEDAAILREKVKTWLARSEDSLYT